MANRTQENTNSHANLEFKPSEVETLISSLARAKMPYKETLWRWPALIFMNLLLLGYFAVFDCPQPLEEPIKNLLQVDDQKYSELYSFFAIPNIVLPIIAGTIVDKMGVRPSMIIFTVLVIAGQALLTMGASVLSFNIMLAGRVLYSLGADPLNIAQIVMVNHWFKGKELALAISLGSLMSGCGKAINSIFVPLIYNSTQNLAAPLAFGCAICAFSGVCAIIMVIWDNENEKRELIINPQDDSRTKNSEKVNLKDIKKFKLIVWLLVMNYGILDGVVFTIRSFLNDFYQNSYNYSITKAGNYISVHYVFMAICSPLMGRFVDKIGRRATILLLNAFIGVIAFSFYVFVPSCQGCMTPIIPLILLGLYIAFDDAAVFASLPLVLEEKYLGTGYGLYYVMVNIFLTILPPITGKITSSFSDVVTGYYWTSVFLLTLTIIGALETVWLFVVDKKNGGVLERVISTNDNMPAKLESAMSVSTPLVNNEYNI